MLAEAEALADEETVAVGETAAVVATPDVMAWLSDCTPIPSQAVRVSMPIIRPKALIGIPFRASVTSRYSRLHG